MSSGICVCVEGRHTKSLPYKGHIYEVSNILNLNKILKLASDKDLGVVYLSTDYGIVYSDDIIEYSKNSLYKYKGYKKKVWECTVAEQIYRICLDFFTTNVYFAINHYHSYLGLIKRLEDKGLNVKVLKI